MKKINVIAILSLIVATVFTSAVTAQTARVQVIHNSADLAAEYVDVRANGALLIDNFQFRTASPFINVDAGVPITITIHDSASQNAQNPLFTTTQTFTNGEIYVVVASGIVSPTGYSPATPFNLFVRNMGREAATQASNTDVMVFHGATDAPMVDVVEVSVPAGTIVDNLSFGDFQGYLELGTADYDLQIRTQDNSTVVEYDAALAGLNLQGAAAVVLASGFLDPSSNSNGPAFGLYAALPTGGALVQINTQPISTARAQVIHNSADLAAEFVDVRANGALLLNNFEFRTASPFIDVPAGVQITLTIHDSSSTDASNPLFTKNVTLTGGERYVIVASGIVSASGYSPATPFDLFVNNMGREAASQASNTDLMVFHGATDAPTVDAVEVSVPAGTIVDDLSFGQFQGYLELATADYDLQIRTQDNSIVVEYDVALAGLQGAAAVVLASGFLDPSVNSNGEAFGLYAALPTGGALIQIDPQPISTARAQVIHNSADLAAEFVDVRANGALLLNNFEFRTASPFVDVPAGVQITLTIHDSASTDASNPLFTKNVTLTGGERYVIVAGGIVSASGYSPATPFDLFVNAMGREAASQASNTDVMVFHGATDAPTVDVVEVSVPAGTIVDDLSFGDFQGYLELGTADYDLQIRTQDNSTVAEYDAALAGLNLQGASTVVVASGFLSPMNNSNGPAFGLYAALPTGGPLVQISSQTISTARAQVIHNAADLAAEFVDIRVNGDLLLNNFEFRTASPFIDVPADVALNITIHDSASVDASNPLYTRNVTLSGGERYIIVASGIVSTSGYSPATPFDLFIYAEGEEAAQNPSNTEVVAFHGATDAPTVFLDEVSGTPTKVIDFIAHGDFFKADLATADYALAVKDSASESTVAVYEANLANLNLQGAAITVLASGFLTPADNSNGPAFGLYAVTPAGGAFLPLPVRQGVGFDELPSNVTDFALYPNPATSRVNIDLELKQNEQVVVTIYDLTGRKVIADNLGSQNAGINTVDLDVSGLNNGLYVYQLQVGNEVLTGKLSISK